MNSGEAALRFSIVIPTYQRRDIVLGSVRALAALRYPEPFQVITVVDGSSDGTADALHRLETPFPLVVIEQPNEGRAAACNHGASRARGELLLFLDDDMQADPALLAQHDRSHRDGADVVLGHIPLDPRSPRGLLSAAVGAWADHRARSLLERRGALELQDFLTGQMSLRRETFLAVGGFDTRFTRGGTFGGEDLDLGRRLVNEGCQIVFNPDAISHQRYVVTPREYMLQWRQNGRSAVMLARRHPDEADRIFHRRETRFDRLAARPLRPLLRELALALAATGTTNARIAYWFFRVRNLEYFQGIRDAGGRPARRPVRVLCYHSISDLGGAPIVEPYGIPPREFHRQLTLAARHFRFISADEFDRYLRGAGVPRRAVLLTFDDCYEDLLHTGLPMLRELNVPALAFAVTARLGKTNDWDEPLGAHQIKLLDAKGLQALREAGVAIGTHTRTHRMLNQVSRDEVAAEIEGSVADLETLGFTKPLFLAYPHGEHSADVRQAVGEAGLAGAFTVEADVVHPGCDAFAIPRIEILRGDRGWRFIWKLLTAGMHLSIK